MTTDTQTRALAVLQALALPIGTSLVATGSLARGEMTEHSDVDLILLHEPGTEIDPNIWYPVWDAKLRLDYAVRTPLECVEIMRQDSTAALALLDMRFIAGNEELARTTREEVLKAWRRQLAANFDQVVDLAIARWRRSGSMVAMTHPDLKHGRGGLRDIELIRALALGNLADQPDLSEQRKLLLDVRRKLHLHAGRARDVLDPEFAVDVAIDLGFKDRYELSRALAQAARTVDQALNQALETARGVLPKRTFLRAKVRRPVDVDVVESQGQLELARNPNLEDPGLLLRVAAASARTGLPISAPTWARLSQLPPLSAPWPEVVANDFFALLSSPEVISQLDEHGLWAPLVPEWEHIRGRMPREPIHIHTIDQHSLVVLSLCAQDSVHVARPDLLMLAALFHDIGKGQDRPHEEVGAEMVAGMAEKLNLSVQDTAVVRTLVAQHTLIPQLVSTTDYQSEAVAEVLLDALNYDPLTLDLLEVLVRADAQGTGPGVWSRNLQYGTATLCAGAGSKLHQAPPQPPQLPASMPLGVRLLAASNTSAEITFHGSNLADFDCLLAVIAAMEWNIEKVEMDFSGSVRARLEVYNLLGKGFDEQRFLQILASKVHTAVPAGAPGLFATFWNGPILEVRAQDRMGAFGTLLKALPPLRWLRSSTPGATMIMVCELEEGFQRAEVERAMARALSPKQR
ncbi:[protein-PII] uridylyltransferase [Corynebacterium sp. 153RC1]|uniref:[protein-PII] uridylyltransferase n=1 Tax=unclassified Corynebacterium TaxID=2624378 RepID=UPI00211C3931|nr:[protein-PII] uridylyltransferase [Corynebacterium sp. 209RC1]MCQ9354019.1 [protein-PII] uridylyltransferase [Corynebacterium sp. 1222RC1]MCQ9355933.1 [protein-PII] uridylyltransferase [Corynebacterium sp. 122RC1]MCQ9358177.1 [protein-PII] uridylyltransferase [Corynebacterium sp. 142RC1]MCQ9360219.1 [protein-PII] uridylyltransferase [Corynebacterium sp. 153RC1]MCQ9362461.1 [protein-PII] uridylyltransferase [Corynebacterium sp. 732RC1]MCQ9364839.1 [protein-PII] uridylyltransferase [Coryneba